MDLMKRLLTFVAEHFPQITSLLYVVNNKCNDTINDLDVMVFKGNDHIFERNHFIKLIPDRRIIFIRWPVILPD